ncbi:uncharacterized protein LOC128992666 isoform X2 [Macrosteles quadrilineatus]|uniref:uncharacterized protein LOC128992666 isoform X2 n=1 Tax=Macrosteles quadrilineatus TaxID=74068 RepID=UPI0023E34FE2|nr:uncharacterized protein LOC128992666 isoform X2 [Macrosteles quadrilineatus]
MSFCQKSPKLRKGMIIGMGNSMLDLIGYVDTSMLEKYGLLANNGYMAEKVHMGLFQELIDEGKAELVVGGSVQNTFRVVQWVLGEPEVCIIFGGIGCDKEGEELVGKARADGVDTQYQYIEGVPTGICAVLLTKNGAERTLVANLSAAKCFTVDHLMKEDNLSRMLNADIFYISGFFLAVSQDAVVHSAKMAAKYGKWFMMNLSATYIAEQYMDGWNEVFPYIDVLFGNETEARSFAKESQFEEVNDVSQIALKLSCLPKNNLSRTRIVVITQGPDPVVVAEAQSLNLKV